MDSSNFRQMTDSSTCSNSLPPFVPLNQLNPDWVVEEPSSGDSTQPFSGEGLVNEAHPGLFVDSQPLDDPDDDFFSETLARNLATVPDTEDDDPRNVISDAMKAFIRSSHSVSTYGMARCDLETPDMGLSRSVASPPQGRRLCELCEVARDGFIEPDATQTPSEMVPSIGKIFWRRGNIGYEEGSDAARLMAEMVVYDARGEATNSPTSQVAKIGFQGPISGRLFSKDGYFRSRWVTECTDDSSPPAWKEYERGSSFSCMRKWVIHLKPGPYGRT